MSFGRIIIHRYQPGEKEKWLEFEKKVTEILTRECLRYGGDKVKALVAAELELKLLVEHNPEQRDKISFHADQSAKRFLED
jgi:hypothetical protein